MADKMSKKQQNSRSKATHDDENQVSQVMASSTTIDIAELEPILESFNEDSTKQVICREIRDLSTKI